MNGRNLSLSDQSKAHSKKDGNEAKSKKTPTPTQGLVESGLETEHPVLKTGVGLHDPATYILIHYYSHRQSVKPKKLKRIKKYIINLNMIEGSHFHSLDEYLEIKDRYTKEQVQRQGNLIYGHFSLSKYLPHNHYLQSHLAICTQWFHYKRSIVFSWICRNLLIYKFVQPPYRALSISQRTQST